MDPRPYVSLVFVLHVRAHPSHYQVLGKRASRRESGRRCPCTDYMGCWCCGWCWQFPVSYNAMRVIIHRGRGRVRGTSRPRPWRGAGPGRVRCHPWVRVYACRGGPQQPVPGRGGRGRGRWRWRGSRPGTRRDQSHWSRSQSRWRREGAAGSGTCRGRGCLRWGRSFHLEADGLSDGIEGVHPQRQRVHRFTRLDARVLRVRPPTTRHFWRL